MKRMNTALILAGGTGSRMGAGRCPKQYLMLRERPVIYYCLQVFQKHDQIDHIVVVADGAWTGFIDEWIQQGGINKFKGYAAPGETRQFSILNGLERIKILLPETEKVIIHDAARPFLPSELITRCLAGLEQAMGVMPVLPMKDTCYQSRDGTYITGCLPRDQLFAGQAPEAFWFASYLELHRQIDRDDLRKIHGSSEIVCKSGMDVLMIQGSEKNIKITTREDLLLAEKYMGGES